MTKFIQVDYQDGEFKEIFELDDGHRLFDEIKANMDIGQTITLKLIELTDEQWTEIQRISEEMA